MTDEKMFHPKFDPMDYETHNWTFAEVYVFVAIFAILLLVFKCSLMIYANAIQK
jgi:hypothetical protein